MPSQAAIDEEVRRRQALLPLAMNFRNGYVAIEGVNYQHDGYEVVFMWNVYVSTSFGGGGRMMMTDQAVRNLRRLFDIIEPEPKDPTIVRVELHQVEQGRRRRRRHRELDAPPAAADDEVSQIKKRMLEGR